MSRGPGSHAVTRAVQLEIRQRVAAGEPIKSVAVTVDRTVRMVQRILRRSGGIPPRPTSRSTLRLSLAEREEISRGLRAGESLRHISGRLGRAPSTVSREVTANGGRRRYRAYLGEARAARRVRRPRPTKLARDPRLRHAVERLLAERWSPQQVAARLRHDHPNEPELWVSHETIYQSLFVQGRGALRAELTRCLRRGQTRRRPVGHFRPPGSMRDMILIVSGRSLGSTSATWNLLLDRWLGGTKKDRGSCLDPRPRERSTVPLPVDQEVRDLRPHPPHGRAARAYTSPGTVW